MILVLRKNKFQDIIILDGKKRSFFISFFLKGRKSILLQSKKLEFISKFFNYNCVINYEIQNQLKNFSYLASLLNFNIVLKEINIYKNYYLKKKYDFNNDYIIIHLDEKWFTDFYYQDFTNINPQSAHIEKFIKKIISISKNHFDIVITTGAKKLKNLTEFVSDFKTIDNNTSNKKIENRLVTYIHKTTFNDLESLIKNCSLLICCEGGVSHVSYNFDINTIAFFEKTRLQHTKYWTGHMDKLSLYPRKNMKNLLDDSNFFSLFEKKINNL